MKVILICMLVVMGSTLNAQANYCLCELTEYRGWSAHANLVLYGDNANRITVLNNLQYSNHSYEPVRDPRNVVMRYCEKTLRKHPACD